MRQGNKKIFHLEAWVVKVMSIYKAGLSLKLQCPHLIERTRTGSALLL